MTFGGFYREFVDDFVSDIDVSRINNVKGDHRPHFYRPTIFSVRCFVVEISHSVSNHLMGLTPSHHILL